jgi:uncharacterized protein (TIGR00290 family)
MHGVRRELLYQQVHEIGLPLLTIEVPEQPNMQEYEQAMFQKVEALKDIGCTHAIFGDIFLEDLRQYRENKLKEAGIVCNFPLWKQSTRELVYEFLRLGFKTIIVCVNEQFLGSSFCGRIIDENFLSDLPDNVDPCGENGEFHSFVYQAPLFKNPISINKGEIVYRKYAAPKNADDDQHSCAGTADYGFYFCDILPV